MPKRWSKCEIVSFGRKMVNWQQDNCSSQKPWNSPGAQEIWDWKELSLANVEGSTSRFHCSAFDWLCALCKVTRSPFGLAHLLCFASFHLLKNGHEHLDNCAVTFRWMDFVQAQILSEIGSDCQYQNSESCPVSNQKLTDLYQLQSWASCWKVWAEVDTSSYQWK
jgi:hypothetical protein